MKEFSDKVIIVTGASEGIGRALCLELAGQGPKLAVAARNEGRLVELKSELERRGAEVLVVPTDVSDPDQCRAVIEKTVEKWGRIDVLVNNAGITLWTRVEDIEDVSVFERIMKTNYLGAVHCTYYALPHLKKVKGRIAATASALAFLPAPTHSAYCGSKYAMIGFFDTLRAELHGTGVSVTVIAPGFVKSEIHARALDRHGKPLGKSPVEKDIYMPAEKAAIMIARALEKRKRLLIMDPKVRLARWMAIISPRLVETIMEKTFMDATGGRTF